MIILGLIFGFLGALAIVFAWGMPWWSRPHWHENWSPRLVCIGAAALSVSFLFQIIGTLN
jgi:hypothetical protein